MVALFHLDVFSHFSLLKFVGNSYLFVDFFFVLSGFVIAANYGDRLAEGFGAGRFMLLRFGRIYPLHFVLVLVFIPIDIAKDGVTPDLWQAVITNILLLHGLGVNEWNALNFPSWSISSEFAAYVVFAGIVFRVGSSTLPWLFMLILGPAVLWLSPYAMDSTYDFGWTRCLYGFAAGVLCYSLRDALPAMTRRLDFRIDTLIEAAAVILTIWFVTAAGDNRPLSLFGPLLFAGVVLIFAREAGGVSQLLLCRPFLVVGMLTYSIYMLHALVRAVTRAAAMVLEHFLGIPLLRIEIIHHNPEPTKVLWLNGSLWLGDLLQISMLCTTIALAALTYRYVEEPGRNWSRKLAGKAAVKVGISPSPSLTSPADAR